MTNKLMILESTKREVEQLQKFINLVETYEADTLEKWIIYRYAITNSMNKIMEEAAEKGITNDGFLWMELMYQGVINGKVMDELHRIIRRGYRGKVKHHKKTCYRNLFYY